MGMFPRIPAPEVEVFGEHRQEWEESISGVPVFKFRAGDGEDMLVTH
jgi:hypothetical protein